MKNFLLSISLLLMSVSASAQENVLLETWGQNLDLTIPSLEMPSTLGLDSKVKHEIMLGWTCCYRKELITAVHHEALWKSIEYSSRVNQRRYEYTHRWELIDHPTSFDWTLFVSLQLLDIYTTYRGLKYDCVEEANPLFGRRPTVSDMALTKFAVLTPAIQYDRKHGNLNKRTIRSTNTFMALVIGNNMNVMHRADRLCQKR